MPLAYCCSTSILSSILISILNSHWAALDSNARNCSISGWCHSHADFESEEFEFTKWEIFNEGTIPIHRFAFPRDLTTLPRHFAAVALVMINTARTAAERKVLADLKIHGFAIIAMHTLHWRLHRSGPRLTVQRRRQRDCKRRPWRLLQLRRLLLLLLQMGLPVRPTPQTRMTLFKKPNVVGVRVAADEAEAASRHAQFDILFAWRLL
jgi:hypothetical protein